MSNASKKDIDSVLSELNKKYGEGSLIDLGQQDKAFQIETVSTGLVSLDLILGGGVPKGRIVEVYGAEACLSEDTFIPYNVFSIEKNKFINTKGGTIKMLYDRFYDLAKGKPGDHLRNKKVSYFVSSIKGEYNSIFKNPIADIVKTGEKECFEITTESGLKIQATKDHKFYIGEDSFLPLEKLKVGDEVYTHKNTPFKLVEKKQFYYKEVFIKYHPKWRTRKIDGQYLYYRGNVSHAVVEANLNNLEYNEYIKLLNTGENKITKNIKTIPNGYDVHHKNHDHTDNRIENLVVLSKSEHYRYHAKYSDEKLRFIATPEKIKSIKNVGLKETYDIKCFFPHNNYIANNFVVHNSGKTTMTLQFIARCQKAYPEKRAIFIDAENAFDPEYAKKMGVDVDKLIINQPDSGEEALDIVEQLALSGQASIIVVDSVAQLVPQANLAKTIDGAVNIGTTARMLSQNLPRISNACGKTGTVLVFINQIRMKIGVMYGNPETTPGGLALKFAASVRLQISSKKAENRNGNEGCPVVIRVKKNKIAPPFRETELFLAFGKGFDALEDALLTAVDLGLITKSGGWFEYDGIKSHGWATFSEEIQKDEKKVKALIKAVQAKAI